MEATSGRPAVTRLLVAGLLVLFVASGCSKAGTAKEITGKDGAPMVLIPDGEFSYGEGEQSVSLPDFHMDKYEVSVTRYSVFLKASGRKPPQYWDEINLDAYGNRPVVWVTWTDAEAYCRWAGKRLPTEQEWEKAARDGDRRKYPWGDDEPTAALAVYDWDGKRSWQGYATLSGVESVEPGKSPYGLHHMAGNAAEWTSSDFDTSGKVIRGGAWMNTAFDILSSRRASRASTSWNSYVGFRCAQNVSK